VAEGGGGEWLNGVSDQTSRSAVEVCGFLTGVFLSIFTRWRKTKEREKKVGFIFKELSWVECKE